MARFTAVLAATVAAACSNAPRAIEPSAAVSFCDQDDDALVRWRDRQIASMLAPTYDAPTERVLNRADVNASAATAFAQIAPCLAAQPDRYAEHAPLGKPFGNFVRFVRALQWMTKSEAGRSTHQLGMSIPDRVYYESSKARLELPDLLSSKPFMTAMASPAGYARALAMIEEHNATLPELRRWRTVLMKTQFITTVDYDKGIPSDPEATRATYGRLLVYIPNDVADTWVLFGIVTPEMAQDTPMHNVSVFTAVRDRSNPRRTTSYFMDNWRDVRPDGSVRLTPSVYLPQEPGDPENPSNNCYDCHKMAVLPFFPATVYTLDQRGALTPDPSPAATAAVRALNDRIKTYGPPRFPNMDLEAYGPALGPASRARSDAFIRGCAREPLTSANVAAVRDAMSCSECHDEHGYGRLNYLVAVKSARDSTGFLYEVNMLETFIQNGYMPPRSALGEVEKRALVRCLQTEYLDLDARQGLLVDWLEGN